MGSYFYIVFNFYGDLPEKFEDENLVEAAKGSDEHYVLRIARDGSYTEFWGNDSWIEIETK